MINKGYRATEGGVDLSGTIGFRAIFGGNLPGAAHEHRHDVVRSVDGLSALEHVCPHRRTTWWRPAT